MNRPTRATVLTSSTALAALLLAACAGSSSGAGNAASSSPAPASASTPAASPSPSQASSTSTPTATAPVSKAGTLVVVKDFTYVALPTNLTPIVSALKKTGLIKTVKARGLVNGSGDASNPDLAIIISTYKPALATQLEATPVTTVLDNAAKGAEVSAATTGKSIDHVASGTHIRIINGKQLTMGLIYEKGGMLIQIYGPPHSSEVLRFAEAYLAAGG
jgi:hypothetical protein